MSEVNVLENPYKCAVCDERFSEKSTLEKHYFSHAKKKFGVKGCRECSGFCMKGPEHFKSKKRARCIRCVRCKIYFESKEKFLEHNNIKHKNTCEFCAKSFTTKIGVVLHSRIHLNIKPYVCDICDKAFSWKNVLRVHLATHSNVKAFACEFCNRHFSLKSGLKKHYLTHTHEKPYVCEICGRCFSAKGNLKTHYRTHNKVKKESIIL